MKKIVFMSMGFVLFLAPALLVTGCADEEGEEDFCLSLPTRCDVDGERRCDSDNLGIEECLPNTAGCLVWQGFSDCPSGRLCDDTAGEPECVCQDTCPGEGELRCSGTVIQRCESGPDGCLAWMEFQNCADDGMTCDDTGGDPYCVAGCVNECLSGQSKCSGTVIQRCTEDENGCFAWQDYFDCLTESQFCEDDTGEAQCSGECRSDCENEGEGRCSGTIIQECVVIIGDCMQWNDILDCALSDRVCDDTSGRPLCSGGCTDTCDTEDDTRCDGDIVQTCTELSSGCLAWQDGADCSADGKVCDDSSGTAECSCGTPCTTGETRCRGTIIQTCALLSSGCYGFEDDEDCADTGFVCDASSGDAECVCAPACTSGVTRCVGTMLQTCEVQTNGCLDFGDTQDCSTLGLICSDRVTPAACAEGLGESCAVPGVVTTTPFVLTGTNISTDFADDQALGGTGCRLRTGSVEAVFSIDLLAGETVLARELGSVDIVLSIMTTCSDTGECHVSTDYPEEARYTATVDQTVYIIFEAYYSSTTSGYDFRIDILDPEDCGDGIDNDVDGDTDCADSDCFGVDPYCLTETHCGDGADNDADGQTDCDDADCAPTMACLPYKGYWEEFETGDPFDLAGYSITFTPDSGDVNLYTWTASDGVTNYPVTAGTGTTTSPLSLSDDSSVLYTLSTAGTFTFFGTTYSDMYVGSNGYITFGEGYSYSDYDLASFFDLPRIGILDDDLDPSSGGTVTVDEFSDRIVVTYDNVPYWSSTTGNDFQVVLHSDAHSSPGVIEFYYVDIALSTGLFVGISNGMGSGVYPDETDFVYVPPPPPAFVHINEVVYDNNGADSREFVELHGEAGGGMNGYTLVHYDGAAGGVIWAVGLDVLDIPADGFLVVGDAGVPNLDGGWAARGVTDEDGLQNDQESLVLYTGWDGSTGTVIDAVGWGTAASFHGEGSPAPEIEFESWDNSIGRYPDGTDTNNNAADFVQSWWDTPGEANTQAQPTGWVRLTGSTQGNDTYPVIIPDDDLTGVTLTITSPAWLSATISDIYVGVKIRHVYIGDLHVDFTSPAATTVTLHNNTGGSADNIFTVYDLVTTPDVGSMGSFDGQSTSPGTGTWSLNAYDNFVIFEGAVEEWIIWLGP